MYKKAHLSGVIFASIFGLTFMFSKTALDFITPIGLIAYRFLLAFFVFEALRRFKLIRVRFKRSTMKALLLVALFQPVAYFLFETYGLHLTTSAEAGMMIALIPIFVTILSTLILKEKPRLIQLLFIALSVAGVLLIQLFQAFGALEPQFFGYILLLMAVLSAAAYNIASRYASKLGVTTSEVTYFMMLVGAILFNTLYLIELGVNEGMTYYIRYLGNLELLLPIVYLGVVGSIGGFFLLNYALSQLEAHVISIYANIATIVAMTAGAVFLNEILEWHHYLGAAMILIGVYGTIRTNKKPKINPSML